MKYRLHPDKRIRHIISGPFIYGMFFPLVLFDLALEIYHHVCFRLYGIPIVKRSDYIIIDRYKLKYLTFHEKINCFYCGYANGLIAYMEAVAGATEEYWCSIKHEQYGRHVPNHHQQFLEYGDEGSFKNLGDN